MMGKKTAQYYCEFYLLIAHNTPLITCHIVNFEARMC